MDWNKICVENQKDMCPRCWGEPNAIEIPTSLRNSGFPKYLACQSFLQTWPNKLLFKQTADYYT